MIKKIALLFLHFCLFPFLLFAKPYVTAEFLGELGNQFFTIAAATSLALDHDAVPIFPGFKESTRLNIPINGKNVFPHLNVDLIGSPEYVYYEPHFHYAPIPYVPNMKLFGHFQSEKYFAHHKQEILNLFAPTTEIMEYLTAKYTDILHDPNTVSIHLRFYHEDPEEKIYVGCRRNFIEKAISLFPEDTHFIVFSNRMERCKMFLAGIDRDLRFIEGESHYHDFYLMSRCKHNIICNSTFSWWAAYLNPNPSKKVVVPAVWFTPQSGLSMQDLLPETWIAIH